MNEIYETLVNNNAEQNTKTYTLTLHRTSEYMFFLNAFKEAKTPDPFPLFPEKKILRAEQKKQEHLLTIASIADELLQDLSITFLNNSPQAGARLLQLQDLSNGDLAVNNSWTVSSEIYETTSASMFGATETDIITLISSDNEAFNHSALYLTFNENEEAHVLDFTARQYDETLLFPYVATVKEWQRTISDLTNSSLEITVGETI